MSAVRPLAPGDETAWRALWGAYLAFYGTERPEVVYATTFARLLDPAEPMSGMTAEVDERPAGLVHVVRHRHCWHRADVLYLQDLYVAPEARGRGLGRALIEAAYSIADAEGLASVYWLTQHFNAEARALYDRVAALTPFVKYQR